MFYYEGLKVRRTVEAVKYQLTTSLDYSENVAFVLEGSQAVTQASTGT